MRNMTLPNPAYLQAVQQLNWGWFAQRFRFARMRTRDLDAVMAIERQVYPDPWSRYVFLYELMQNPLAHLLVMRTRTFPSRLVGYVTLRILEKEAHLTNLALHPDYQNRGLGRYLLAYVMDYAHRHGALTMWLEVRRSNEIAQRLYRRFGFRQVRVLPAYYPNGEDALVMSARLMGLFQAPRPQAPVWTPGEGV